MIEVMTPVGYALWAVLRRDPSPSTSAIDSAESVAELDKLTEVLSAEGVTIRGFYDVSAFRADADLMIWIHGDAAEKLQDAYRRLRRTELLSQLVPTWNAMGVHRDAEFSANHVPAFLRGVEPAGWLTVYPFVRSYEWYLLPEDERRAMLGQHGRKGAEFRSVITNTVSAFALGDYEWILPLEADELTDLVDLMRHLRDTDARRHVREEIPFYTGRRITTAEILDVLA